MLWKKQKGFCIHQYSLIIPLSSSLSFSLSLSLSLSRSITMLVIQTKPMFRDNDRFTCSSQALDVICKDTKRIILIVICDANIDVPRCSSSCSINVIPFVSWYLSSFGAFIFLHYVILCIILFLFDIFRHISLSCL